MLLFWNALNPCYVYHLEVFQVGFRHNIYPLRTSSLIVEIFVNLLQNHRSTLLISTLTRCSRLHFFIRALPVP